MTETKVSEPTATYDTSEVKEAGVSAEFAESEPVHYSRGEHPKSQANLQMWTSETRPTPTNTGPVLTPKLRRFADMSPEALQTLVDGGTLTNAEKTAAIWWLDSHKGNVRYGTGHHSRAQLADRLDGPVNKQEVNVNIGVVIRGYGELDEGSIG